MEVLEDTAQSGPMPGSGTMTAAKSSPMSGHPGQTRSMQTPNPNETRWN